MYRKKYYEEYARLTLKYIFQYPVENFICADKPDIQNKTNGIGIEVTRTGNQELMKTDAYGNDFLNKKPTEKKIERFGGKFFLKDDGTVYGYSASKGLFTPSICICSSIACALQKKKSQFNSYTKFNRMGLYCFIGFSIADDIDIKEITALDFEPFDFLIVNSVDAVYNIENKKVKKISLTDQLEDIKKMALKNAGLKNK